MHIVKSVGVLSVAKIMGAVYACIALIFAPFLLIAGLLGSFAGQDHSPLAGIFGVGFAVMMPILYGLLGFIGGAIGALLYNLFARWVGGIELNLEGPHTAPMAYPVTSPAATAL